MATKKKAEAPGITKPTNDKGKSKRKKSTAEEAAPAYSFPIVGIGASAGGLEAFEQFFSKMPPDTGMAFVLVPHLDPKHASMMTELLRRVTKMTVTEAEHRMKVKPNNLYVIPPNKEMSISKGTLNLEEPQKVHGLRMPIDFFFRSLGEDQGEWAVGIILSGTGSDGTLGLRAIHGAGGIVMAQEPATAKYAGMPSSAVQTGLADYIVAVDKMPGQLTTYMKQVLRKEQIPALERKKDLIFKILSLVRSTTGHDFSLYKKTTLTRRIEKRMGLHDLDEISRYVRYLQEHPEEIQLLFKDLVIGVTHFFRDTEAFDILKKKVLPKYLDSKPEGYSIRVWVPGSGTGEEAFSLAMILSECLEEMKRNDKIQIFGTDIDEEAINQARAGIYSNNIAADVSPDRLRRFFIKEENGFRVKKEIRETVVFAIQDLVKDPPFTKLDLVSCRNLLIYLEPELQNRILPLFHYSLKSEGILFLGSSESIGKYGELFDPLDRRWKVFRSKKVVPSLQEELWKGLPWAHVQPPRGGDAEEPIVTRQVDTATVAQKLLLETFAPPSVIVNEKGDILYIHGQTGKYLEVAPGRPLLNVLDMAREGIKFECRSGIDYALTRGKERRYQKLQVKHNSDYQRLNLTVKPLQAKEMQGLVMVSFEDIVTEKERKEKVGKKTPPVQTKRMDELERELAYTRETLQATIEELQASNEELKSTNEELQSTNEEFQSANEELETSREELQSVNEELVTLNSELQAKIDQLSMTENDMKVLLDNTQIGIIFLENDLRIKRFTSEATKVFNLIGTDIGRPLHDIRSALEFDDIEIEARKVLESLQMKELEIHSKTGHWYLMRIIPYRTAENMIDGVVLTFNDVTKMRGVSDADRFVHETTDYAKNIADAVRQPLLVLDDDFQVISANRAFYENFGISEAETVGRRIYDLGDREWDIPSLKKLLEEFLPERQKFDDYLVEHDFPRIGHKRVMLNARKVIQKEAIGKPLILIAIEDVTDK